MVVHMILAVPGCMHDWVALLTGVCASLTVRVRGLLERVAAFVGARC